MTIQVHGSDLCSTYRIHQSGSLKIWKYANDLCLTHICLNFVVVLNCGNVGIWKYAHETISFLDEKSSAPFIRVCVQSLWTSFILWKLGPVKSSPSLYITEMWKRNLNKENVIGTVLIDFRKAFDSVDDSILSYKMDACGLHGKLKDWIQSYLLDRKQFVIVNGKRPGLQIVPLLGPKLFSIFVDDLPDCISNGESTSMLMTPQHSL